MYAINKKSLAGILALGIIAAGAFFAFTPQVRAGAGVAANLSTTNSPVTYDGNSHSANVVSDAVGGGVVSDIKYDGSSTEPTDAGTYTVTADFAPTDTGTYAALDDAPAGTLTISPLNLTISGAVAGDKNYNGNDVATVDFTGASLVGAIGGDVVSINSTGYSATFNNKNVGNGKAVSVTGVVLAGGDAGNYTVSQPAGLTANITARSLTVTAQTDTKVYDGTPASAVSPNVPALQGTDTVGTAPTQVFDNKNVGTGKTLTASGLVVSDGNGGANYNVSYTTDTTGVITAAPLTITAQTNTKAYDGNTSAAAVPVVTGLQGSDTVTGKAETYDTKDFGSGKTLSVSAYTVNDGNSGLNYTVTPVTTTGTISKKNLTISGVTASNKTYDGATTATTSFSGATLNGIVGSEDVTINSSGYTASFNTKNIGTGKAITISGVTLSGADAGNYTVSQPTGVTANITAKNLTVSGAAAVGKTYDGNNTATVDFTSAAVVGKVGTEDVTVNSGSYSATYADKHAAPGKAITVIGVTLSGTDAGNYTVSQPTGLTATISKRNLTVTAQTDTRVYNGTTTSSVSPSVPALQGTDTVGTAPTQTFDTKNVGTGKTLTASGLVVNDGNSGNDYNVSYTADTTGVITAKSLTVSATANSKVYDSTTAATASLSDDRISGDSLSVASTSVTFASANVGTGIVVTVNGISISGTDSGNYSANTSATSAANITARPITVTADAQTKVYSKDAGTDPSFSYSVTSGNLVGSDVITGSLSRVAGESVGSYSITQGTLTAGSNYNLTYVPANLSITQKSLTVTLTADDKVYDGSAAATGTFGDDRISGDTLSIASTSVTFADKTVGTGKTVTAAGISISGTDSGNYSVNTSATDTADITARTLTVSATANSKVYDGTTAATATLSDDRILGDSFAVASTSVVFDSASVGSAINVTVGGLSISGTDSGNYTLASGTTTSSANITVKPITVTADSLSKEFAGADPTFTYTPNTLISGNSFAGALTRAAGETLGTYAITQGTLSAGSNYSMTFVPGVFTIVDTTAPVITLSGDATTSVAKGNAYVEPGYSATDAVDGSVTPVVSGTYDVNTNGTYTLTYTATDAHSNVSTKTRDIVVSDSSLSVTPATVGSTTVGTLTNAQSDSDSSGGTVISTQMPANLTITGPLGWNGTIELPTATTIPSGLPNNAVVQSSIEIGFPDVLLTFDKGVRLFFVNQADKLIGYSRNGSFTGITNTCASDSQSTGDALPAGGDCRIVVGNDLVVWTKHFTNFVSYINNQNSGGGGGGSGGNGPIASGGGGGSRTPIVTPSTPATQGQVLGAATFNFASDLKIGASGQAVTELQNILIAQSFLKGSATGYFGGLTKAAVIAYQKAHGITPSGMVGPMTRAELNKGTTPSTPASADAEKAAKIKELQDLVQKLLAQIAALKK